MQHKHQPFTAQQRSQRSLLLQKFRQYVDSVSGGESLEFYTHFLTKTREGKKVLQACLEVHDKEKLQKIVVASRTLQEQSRSKDSVLFLRPIARVLSRVEVGQLGWKVSRKKFTAARKMITKEIRGNKKLQPGLKRMIEEFYRNSSKPIANRTVKRKTGEVIPCLGRVDTIRELHRRFLEENCERTVSLSTFYKCKPIEVKSSKRKTDVCQICEDYKQYTKRQRTAERQPQPAPSPGTPVALGERPNGVPESVLLPRRAPPPLVNYEELYQAHKKVADSQREFFKNSCSTVGRGEFIVVADFKENIKINRAPVETGRHFYHRRQVSCLGFVIFTRNQQGTVEKRHVNYLSDILSHDGKFVSECTLKCVDFLKAEYGQITNISFWYDCARHFRSKENLHCLFCDVPQMIGGNAKVQMNHFGEQHGKSPADQHFSVISRILEQESKKQGIFSIEALKSVLETKLPPLSHVFLFSYDSRDEIKELSCVESSSKKAISMDLFHSFELDGENIAISALSGGASPRKMCSVQVSTRHDTREIKRAPPQVVWQEPKGDEPPFGPRRVKRLKELGDLLS